MIMNLRTTILETLSEARVERQGCFAYNRAAHDLRAAGAAAVDEMEDVIRGVVDPELRRLRGSQNGPYQTAGAFPGLTHLLLAYHLAAAADGTRAVQLIETLGEETRLQIISASGAAFRRTAAGRAFGVEPPSEWIRFLQSQSAASDDRVQVAARRALAFIENGSWKERTSDS